MKTKRFAAVFTSLLAGVLLALLIQLNAALGKRIGVLESSFIAHLVGSLLAFFIVSIRIKKGLAQKIISLPKYLFVGGVLGVLITVVGNIVVPALGLLFYMSLLTTLDLIFSAVVDHVGLFGLQRFRITAKRMIGLLLASVGVMLIFWG